MNNIKSINEYRENINEKLQNQTMVLENAYGELEAERSRAGIMLDNGVTPKMTGIENALAAKNKAKEEYLELLRKKTGDKAFTEALKQLS